MEFNKEEIFYIYKILLNLIKKIKMIKKKKKLITRLESKVINKYMKKYQLLEK